MPATFWEQSWREALDEEAASPQSDDWTNDIDQRKMKFIRRYAPKAGIALEVGCGSARLLARVGREFSDLRLVAVDESPAALELSQRTASAFGVEIESRIASADALPLADE